MKKLQVTVNGIKYDVEVEMIQDCAQPATYTPVPVAIAPAPVAPSPAPVAKPVAPAPAPAATPTTAGNGIKLEAPIAGLVVEIKVAVGDTVQANQPVVVLEAMKMNTNINAPQAGKVTKIHVKTGDNVQFGQILMSFE